MTEKQWGPFGMGQWKGHPNVYCRICGWPVYSMWVDDVPPSGDCIEGKTAAIGCQTVLEKLMQNAWVRAATGKSEPHAAMEMLRGCTGLSWAQIEEMTDKSGRSQNKISEMKKAPPN